MSNYVELTVGDTGHLFDAVQDYMAPKLKTLCGEEFVTANVFNYRNEPICELCVERENKIEAQTAVFYGRDGAREGFFE